MKKCEKEKKLYIDSQFPSNYKSLFKNFSEATTEDAKDWKDIEWTRLKDIEMYKGSG